MTQRSRGVTLKAGGTIEHILGQGGGNLTKPVKIQNVTFWVAYIQFM